jgi:hypothetical protein
MTDAKRELPLVRRRIEALLKKTIGNGCTAGEAMTAFEKAEELVAKYKLDPDSFWWPQKPSAAESVPASVPKASKAPRTSISSRGLGIGKLAERLIVEHPEWSHAEIAAEVNRRLDYARATSKSVRWYASRMRARGEEVPSRRRKRA